MSSSRFSRAVADFALAVLFAVVPLSHAQIIYSDGDFGSGNWSFQTSTSLGSAASASRIASGGNPGANLQVTLSMVAGNGYSVLWGFNSSALYDPASGAIETVGYAEDLLQVGSPQAAGAALLQNGLRYYRYAWTTDSPVWTNRIATPDVGASGYLLDDSQNNGVNPINPNFSILGTPITFGFFRNISGTALTDFTSTSRLDNWTTTVTPVPEPSIGYLIIAAAIVFTSGRIAKKLRLGQRRIRLQRAHEN